jgi:aminopeptidase N
VLAKIKFTPSPEMLKAQLKSDVIGRMIAVQALAEKTDAASVALLKGVLNGDAFHGVRSEAAKALKKQGSPEALAALAASITQPDARTRQEVVNALAAFSQQDARNTLWDMAQKEKNPDILAAIIKTWGARPAEAPIAAALRKHLDSTNYKESLASAAIAALRAQDDHSAAPFILARIQRQPENFPTRAFASALDALAFLSREEKDRSAVRNFLIAHLSHPMVDLRIAAAQALGTLGDPAAIAVLEPLTLVAKPWSDALRDMAEKSIQSLQSRLDAPAELKNLWQKLQELQKETQKQADELKRELKKAQAAKAK